MNNERKRALAHDCNLWSSDFGEAPDTVCQGTVMVNDGVVFLEPIAVADTYVTGIGRISKAGACLRVVFTLSDDAHGGQEIAAKILIPLEATKAVANALLQAVDAKEIDTALLNSHQAKTAH